MPRSMTGFARIEKPFPWGTITWEIRSVNHRYLELQFRLPEGFRALEPSLREILRNTLQRGKVDISLNIQLEPKASPNISLNQARVQQIAAACEEITHHVPHCNAINPLDILSWPGVQTAPEINIEARQTAALESFKEPLKLLVDHREREGLELAKHIMRRLESINQQVTQVRGDLPRILQQQREKMQTKIALLNVELDSERLEQEIVLMAQKADVDEELDRLDTHIIEVKLTLTQDNSLGRRLDFLMQEFNREANTLSSKSIVSDTTQAAIELKVLIEQIREQVQNIE